MLTSNHPNYIRDNRARIAIFLRLSAEEGRILNGAKTWARSA
jgi:hypothetical protein